MECLPILQRQCRDFSALCLKQTTLDSWDNTYFGLSFLSQESMVLSQLLLDYLYHAEHSVTFLQNLKITTFMNPWLSPLKHQKVEKQQQQNREINH